MSKQSLKQGQMTVVDRFDWLERYGDLIMDPPPLLGPLQPTAAAQAFYRLAYNKEDNDCGVRALAVACAAPYAESHTAFKLLGRLNAMPVSPFLMKQAATWLGYELQRYPKPAGATLKSCGRYLADAVGGYIILTCDHAVGMWNGEIIDWARDTKQRVTQIFKARRIDQ